MAESNTADEEKEVDVADPDNYNQAQRFREIHQARQRVSKKIAAINITEDGKYPTSERKILANAVSAYITELQPLMRQSEWDSAEHIEEYKDMLMEEYNGEELRRWENIKTIHDWVLVVGHTRSEDRAINAATIAESRYVFDVANQFLADVGMGLEMDDGSTDSQFDYGDLLEEGSDGDVTETGAGAPGVSD